MARCLIAFTALLAVGAGILTAHYILLDEQPLGIQDTKFDEVAPNLYRLGSTWTLIRKVVEAHVAVFLVKRGKDYILIDAGVPGANYTDMLIGAVNAATKDGNLRLVLLTHGHLDHVGSLPQVLEAFPSAQVAMHVLEAPYAGGGVSYAEVPADNLMYILVRRLAPDANLTLPVHRILFLSGEEGDVAEVHGAAGQKPKWAPPEGLLEYVRVPGHSPGHLAFLHKPSGSLLAADTFCNLGRAGGLFSKASPPKLSRVPLGSANNLTQNDMDCKKLAGLDFSTCFPSHDHARGLPKEAVEAFANSLDA